MSDQSTSTVQGRVVFTGQLPATELIAVYRDNGVCGDAIQQDLISVDSATRGIDGVVVSLEGVESPRPTPVVRDIVIESDRCRFLPRVSATTTSSNATFRNSDPILHDTQLRKPNSLKPIVFNIIQPSSTPDINKPLTEKGVFVVRCNVHAFMHASLLVFDHPYFAVTDGTGDFMLPDVPAGSIQTTVVA